MLLKGEHLVKSFGGTVAVDDVSLEVNEEILAILGPNGAGKSVLFSLISGGEAGRRPAVSNSRETKIAGLNATGSPAKGIVRTFQLTSFEKLPVAANLALGYYGTHNQRILGSLFHTLREKRQKKVEEKLRKC